MGIQASAADPEEQAKVFAEQMESLQSDATFQEQAKKFTEHMEAMMKDPKIQEQAKLFTEQMEALQEKLKVPQTEQEIEATKAAVKFQDAAKSVAAQLAEMTADPSLHQKAQLFKERLEMMM